MPRAQRVALGIQVFVVVAASLYWALWYGGGRALIASSLAKVAETTVKTPHNDSARAAHTTSRRITTRTRR